jgi:Spy/CpxP family protein refolding chaperone
MKRSLIIPVIAVFLSTVATVVVYAAVQEGVDAAKPHRHHGKEHARIDWQKLKADLKLDPAQDFAWQQIADKRAELSKARRADRASFRETMKSELAKAEPDFARIVEEKRRIEEKNLAVRNELREMQLKLYSTFTAEQKALVREAIKDRFERMEQWRERKRLG